MQLSRIFISLKNEKECVIDYNYHYELLQQLYKAYSLQNEKEAKIFHDKGFQIDNKPMKLLNTCLIFDRANFTKENIQVNRESDIKLMLSGNNEVLNNIVKGLIKMKFIEVGKCSLEIKELIQDKNISFRKTMLYKVLTTVVESVWNNGKTEYLTVYDNRFYETLAQNLRRKYKLIYNEEFKDELYFDIENILNVKQKNINSIKENGYIKGWGNFNIWIQTTKKMQQVIYYCGLGQNNTLGAGTLMYLTSQ